jgi:predicted PhzF superfamily epimerase YddE/YHI9
VSQSNLAMHRLAGMPGEVVIAQGEQVGRPSFIRVTVEEEVGGTWGIDVHGSVRSMGDGAFEF